MRMYDGDRVLIISLPPGIDEFSRLEYDTMPCGSYDHILVFVRSTKEMACVIRDISERQIVNEGEYLDLIYPKKGNKMYGDCIERDSILGDLDAEEDGFFKGTSMKFSMMISLNETFTVAGLRNVKCRTVKKNVSCRTAYDYADRIDELSDLLDAGVSNIQRTDAWISERLGEIRIQRAYRRDRRQKSKRNGADSEMRVQVQRPIQTEGRRRNMMPRLMRYADIAENRENEISGMMHYAYSVKCRSGRNTPSGGIRFDRCKEDHAG